MSGPGPAPGGSRPVVIHYRRLPDDTQDFHQEVVLERADVVVTLARSMRWPEPLRIEGRIALETGSSAVWFTFPGAWHDIGRFHRADGTLTGIYANVLTPVTLGEKPPAWGRLEGESPPEPWRWETTDLCLDLWIPAGTEDRDAVHLLDREELARAERQGWVEPETAARARMEARRLSAAVRTRAWPPAIVEEWTLKRALDAVGRSGGT